MTIFETRTRLTPTEVIESARGYFTHAGTPYAASAEKSGPGYLKLHMDVGEVVIGATEQEGWTLVRGSASRGGHLLARFMTVLGTSEDVAQSTLRRSLPAARAA